MPYVVCLFVSRQYDSVETATAVRTHVDDMEWPAKTGRNLRAVFVSESDAKAAIEQATNPPPAAVAAAPAAAAPPAARNRLGVAAAAAAAAASVKSPREPVAAVNGGGALRGYVCRFVCCAWVGLSHAATEAGGGVGAVAR